MPSPVTVTTSSTKLVGFNSKRSKVVLQNTGAEDVYVVRWFPGTVQPVPSPTNYNFVLFAKPGEGNKVEVLEQIESISAFLGVTSKGSATVAVMETIKMEV